MQEKRKMLFILEIQAWYRLL